MKQLMKYDSVKLNVRLRPNTMVQTSNLSDKQSPLKAGKIFEILLIYMQFKSANANLC